MTSLKDLKVRINSVKATRKITSAMKMVAAAKLRRAQEQAQASRPYSDRMAELIASLAMGIPEGGEAPPLLKGHETDNTHFILMMTSDRGLCGGFNGSVIRQTKQLIQRLLAENKQVKIFCLGRKGRDALRREYKSLVVGFSEISTKGALSFSHASDLTHKILGMFDRYELDTCHLVFSRFKSAMQQIVTVQQLIPYDPGSLSHDVKNFKATVMAEFEPSEEELLTTLLPQNLAVQIYQAMLESYASEQGARMTAMDSATRNAGDMIQRLTLVYNRTRQATITKELIEIISGAEAV